VLVGLTGLFVGPVLLLLDVTPATCGVWRWVEHRAWFMDCSAHCWVLRGHPVWGVSSGPWPGSPNALRCQGGGGRGGLGCGCVLSVA